MLGYNLFFLEDVNVPSSSFGHHYGLWGSQEAHRWKYLLGVVYFVLAEANKLAEHLETLSTNGLTFIMLLWVVVENCVIQWTFRSLWNTLKKLKVKKNMAKLQLYEMFATALVILTLLNIALIYVKMYILAYVLLLLICLFWAPSDKLTRYLYIAEMEDEFEEEEEGALLTKTERRLKMAMRRGMRGGLLWMHSSSSLEIYKGRGMEMHRR